MADGTKIEWTDATVNAINGCTVLSPGCTNCYAMRLDGTRLKNHPTRKGLTQDSKAGPVWTGEVRLNKLALVQPLGWRKPRRIFWNAHGDMFHPAVPKWWIDWCFAVMAMTPQHIHQVLTKRADRMRVYLSDPETPERIGSKQAEIDPSATCYDRLDLDAFWPLPNVWLGVSVEDQTRADERIPDLLATPSAVRWLSCEPLLGRVEIGKWMPGSYECAEECGWRSSSAPEDEVCHHCGWIGTNAGEFCNKCGHQDFGHVCPRCEANAVHQHPDTPNLDWVVVGGESGPGSRPMQDSWARSLRDQCTDAGVPFFFKQWGEYAPYNMEPGVAGFWLDPDGHVYQSPTHWPPAEDEPRTYMIRWGKKRAGRLLDGVQHDGMPG
ncbi:MAG: hypothetical protein COC10_13790 [Sphingobium sp.]|nr:MAG: hypothetical protein COC10_13790 [Sphingobium sp.]